MTRWFQILIAIIYLSGCLGSGPVPVLPVDPELAYDPADGASITRWERGKYNFHQAKIVVISLDHFYDHLGDSQPKPSKLVGIEVWGALTNGVSPEQQAAIDDLVANEQAIHQRVHAALYQDYQKAYPGYHEGMSLGMALYGDDGEKIDDLLPVVKNGNELDQRIDVLSLCVHPAQAGTATIGVVFSNPWNDSYQGVLLKQGQVVEVGQDAASPLYR